MSFNADTLWQQQEESYQKLLSLHHQDAVSAYGLEKLQQALRMAGMKIFIGCMDPRVQMRDGEKKIAIAGSGILLSKEKLGAFIKLLEEAGVKVEGVTYHEDCGACAVYCSLPSPNLSSETEGKDFAQSLVIKFGLPGEPLRVGFGETDPIHMEGDPHFMHARSIVIDCTGRFSARDLGLPAAFEISAKYIGAEEATKELRIALSLISGRRGMGPERFREAPLALVIVVDPRNLSVSEEVEKTIASLVEEYKELVTLVHLRPPVAAF
jgi:hypothetical protein